MIDPPGAIRAVPVSYRDDLDAAHARNADLEQQITALEKRQVAIEPRPRGRGVAAVIGVLAGLGLALGAVLGHLGWLVVASGVLVALVAASGLHTMAPPDGGPYPVRHIVEAPCADADVRVLVICLLTLTRWTPSADLRDRRGAQAFTTDARRRIEEVARDVTEGVVRGAIAARPQAELRAGAEELAQVVRTQVAEALERYGLIVDSLFVSLLR